MNKTELNDKKSLPEKITKNFTLEKQLTENVYTFIGTKEVVDRDGDIVFVDGIELENYKMNPIVLFGHDYNTPIGKTVKFYKKVIDGVKALLFDIEFASTQDAKNIKTLVDEGVLNTTSINFIPKEWEEVRENDRWGYDIKKSELLEISVVSVPANQSALLQKAFDLMTKTEEVIEDVSHEQEVQEEVLEETTVEEKDSSEEIIDAIYNCLMN